MPRASSDQVGMAVPAHPILSFHASLSGPTFVEWPGSTDLARRAGFRATDLVFAEIADESPSAVSERLAAAELAPGPASLPVEFRHDEERFQRDFAELPRIAKLAAAIGVKTVFRAIPASSDVPAPQLYETLRRRITRIASVLAIYGIDFALEPLGPLHRRREARFEFISGIPDAAELAISCPKNVGLLVDAWHWHHGGGTVQDILDARGMILHIHIADAPDLPPDEIRDEKRLLPGEGVIDLPKFFRALKEIGYKRYVTPEIRGYRCLGGPLDCACVAYAAAQASLMSISP